MLKKLLRALAVLAVVYAAACGGLAWVMTRPPEQFGRIIRHVPMPIAWFVLPGPRIWFWARGGTLHEGEPAPDFTLKTQDRTAEVTLSSFRGKAPVVLVFGSYT